MQQRTDDVSRAHISRALPPPDTRTMERDGPAAAAPRPGDALLAAMGEAAAEAAAHERELAAVRAAAAAAAARAEEAEAALDAATHGAQLPRCGSCAAPRVFDARNATQSATRCAPQPLSSRRSWWRRAAARLRWRGCARNARRRPVSALASRPLRRVWRRRAAARLLRVRLQPPWAQRRRALLRLAPTPSEPPPSSLPSRNEPARTQRLLQRRWTPSAPPPPPSALRPRSCVGASQRWKQVLLRSSCETGGPACRLLRVSQRLTCAHAAPELARRAGEAGAPGGAGASALDGFKAKLLAARAENAALRKGACMHPTRAAHLPCAHLCLACLSIAFASSLMRASPRLRRRE